jgi:hypothetical protein
MIVLHATNYNQVPLGTAEPPGTPAPCRSAISPPTCLYSAPAPDTTTPDKVYQQRAHIKQVFTAGIMAVMQYDTSSVFFSSSKHRLSILPR